MWWTKEKDYSLNVRNCKKHWKKWIKEFEENAKYDHPDLDATCAYLGEFMDFPGRFNKTFRKRIPTEKNYPNPQSVYDPYHNLGGRKTRRRR